MFKTLRKPVGSAARLPIATWPELMRPASLLLLLLPQALLSQQLSPSSDAVVVPQGTPVQLRLVETVSSAHARKGDRVEFVVLEDVNQQGVTVIRAGARAWGSVTQVRGKRPFGVPGSLTLQADSVEMANGEIASLRSDMEFKGRRHVVRMIAGMIGAGLIYLPAAPAMLLTRGGDSYALQTSETTAFLDANFSMPAADVSPAAPPSAGLDQLFTFMPPRVLDGRGREGDMVNLVFVAPEPELQQAFQRAGWTSVDHAKHTIAWHLLCHGTHYARLPMAHFFLFGRSQDISFALPDPTFILSRRHHIRIWKTNYLVDNTPVWIAAATHDVSIAMRKLHVTHRIDPQVDAERDFIGDNLVGTRLVASTEYLAPPQPVYRATTASGQPYYSDSRILLVHLTPHSDAVPASLTSASHTRPVDGRLDEATSTSANSFLRVTAKTTLLNAVPSSSAQPSAP